MARKRKRHTRPRRRGRFAWLFKLLVAVAFVCALVVGATVFFRVEQVEVSGMVRYTAEEVALESGIMMQDNLVALPSDEIEKRLLKALPYLETVKVSRRLPNAVRISVTEWDAVAFVETDDGGWLMSVGGKLLEQGDPTGKINVWGLEALLPRAGTQLALPVEDVEKNDSLLDLLAQLEADDLRERVSELDMSHTTTIVMTYDDRFEVILPINGDYEYELQVLESAIENLAPTDRGTFDLTQEDYQAVFTPER